MKHISEMVNMFAQTVSRDQVLKELALEYIGHSTGMSLNNRQVVIGQTVVLLQHLTFAEQTVLQTRCSMDGLVQYINSNPHEFSISDVIIR